MSTGVLTTYYIGKRAYASYVLGNDLNTIQSIVQIRGLNETIESCLMEITPIPDYSTLSDQEFIVRLPEILHTATFLSFIALNAKTTTTKEVLGDEGVIHELTHLLADLHGCHKKSLTCIRDLLRDLQEKAIGFYEPV